jgi:hypothetical protein
MDQAEGVLGILTGMLFIAMSLGIAFWAIYWGHQKKRLQYQERQLMIERGMTPPPVLPDESKRVSPEDSLRRGLVLLFLGVGLGIAYAVLSRPTVDDGPPAWLAGAAAGIVGFLGLGHLAYYLIARRMARDGREKADVAL